MLNLVEKFTPAAVEATDEDGVVAIEYVVLALAVITFVGLVATALGTDAASGLVGKLTSAITAI